MKRALVNGLARALLALVWLLHWLPLPLLSALGSGLGRVLHLVGRQRRRVALVNVELCLPELSPRERAALVREHFRWLGRSLVERGVLWHASEARLKRLIQVEGDVSFAERHAGAVMWLVPHFVGLEICGTAVQLHQTRAGCDVYTPQSNPVLNAAFKRGRSRFGRDMFFERSAGALPVVRAIKRGLAFFNPADMDFGLRDAAFVPFFGVPAATLLAPSRMAKSLNMRVQPLVAEMLPHGRGWRVHFVSPWEHWPTADPEADAAAMNRFVEAQIRLYPAQYLWVHKRFKTRPPGAAPVY
ncbi:MAG: lipid A biosynthesis acyltransferase [Rubrivivax sp.]|nr:lipid A biosynthesis acyltransferase [Rubrivivax sp.]